ncbi:complement component C1q receptor-like [Haliotis asinina]|uniref:complement component C1q receptor-like n=1 Tax=Haliotis asinina TaxID=109174 RepID=UPI0035327286
MVAFVAACLIFAFTGTAYAATPTNCTLTGCGFGGKCINNAAGTASTCVCYEGFEISLQTFECIDIDECNQTSAALCRNGYCHNMYGDYKCNCFPGYLPHFPDGKTCVLSQSNTNTTTSNNFIIDFLNSIPTFLWPYILGEL